jgi:acetyl-CoA acyltransferase
MRDVLIAGVGMTHFGKFLDRGLRSLATEAVAEALADSAVSADEVGMVFFGNATAGLVTGQEMIRGQSALRHTGLLGKPLVNVENACASGSTAAHLASLAVASGAVDVAIAVGAEKMTHPDKAVTFRAFGAGVDLETLREGLDDSSPEGLEDQLTGGGTKSNFMDLYAEMARQYMENSGASAHDFAQVAVKSHKFASLNPKAQYRERVTADEVLASRAVAPPLTLLMCSPVGDGAAAIVFCSKEVAAKKDTGRVRVRASVLLSGTEQPPTALERAIAEAYDKASLGPEDLDVVELHDAAAPAELMYYEELGLCAPGDGAKLLQSGDTDLGGRVPVNTSGGLLSKGHPVGATGCAQLVELTNQLRGRAGDRQAEGARVGLAQNGGGSLGTDAAAMSVTILEAV